MEQILEYFFTEDCIFRSEFEIFHYKEKYFEKDTEFRLLFYVNILWLLDIEMYRMFIMKHFKEYK